MNLESPLKGVTPERATPGHPIWQEIAPELTPRDFRHPHYMDVGFLRLLSRMRRLAKIPFIIVSDMRDEARNQAAGGATKSAHMEVPCRCVDIRVRNSYERALVVFAAREVGFVRIGIYDDRTSVHVDASTELPSPRIWTRV